MQDAFFDKEVEEARQEGLKSLKNEMRSVEVLIERLLAQLLENTSATAERDFHICGL